MRAAVYTEKETLETQEHPAPALGPGDVLLRVHACGVCGTDIIKVKQKLVKGPIVLGHEVAGVVEDIGPKVSKFAKGDRVVVAHHTPCNECHFCRHGNVSMCETFKASNLDPGGFAELLRIPSTHVQMTAHKIPAHVSFEEAVFMEPLACVLRNIKRANLLPGDTALVIGLGSVGLQTAQALEAQNIKVIACDLNEARVKLGTELGVSRSILSTKENLDKAIIEETEGRGVDLAVLTAGNAKVYSEIVQYVRGGGKVSIFAGLPAGEKLSMEINELYKREITVYASYSPSPLELSEALQAISDGTVNVKALEPTRYILDQLPQAIEDVVGQKIFKAIIDPTRTEARS